MCTTTLRTFFKFAVIRFTDYEVIAEKPRVGHLPRIFFGNPVLFPPSVRGLSVLDNALKVSYFRR